MRGRNPLGQRAGGGAVLVVNRLIALIMIGTMGGCATAAQPILTPVEVKVPVAIPIYCQVAKLDKPALPIAALKADSAPADTIRGYAATVAILKGAVLQRDLALEGCVGPAGGPSPASASEGAEAGAAAGAQK